MTLSHRQKLTIIPLLLYWPGIFILAHIPIPQLVYRAQVSDKSIHCLAYLLLIFLLWFSVSPDKKVNWRRAAVWWVFFVMAGYAFVDEWLQDYVGRSSDIMDLLADILGIGIGLIIFSFFSFWSALLIVTAITIFLLTNLARADLSVLLPVTSSLFYLIAYSFFSLVWIQFMRHIMSLKPTAPKWLAAALSLPTGFLLGMKLFSLISGRNFGTQHVIMSLTGITIVVAATYLTVNKIKRIDN